MDKKLFKKIIGNPMFISGIYNYCDRWCERCPLTSRCANYALCEEQFADPKTRDINNEAFWQKLTAVLQLTLDMVKETAEQEGIDLNSPDAEKVVAEERFNEETARNHDCSRAAKTYGKMVDNWFDSAKGLFEEKGDALKVKAQLKIPDANPSAEVSIIKDVVEIIRWYQHQIYIKLMRAIHGELEERPEILDDFSKDSDGSAKVALIAIDRSISAWGNMRKYFPERGDDIIDLLVHLDRLRRKIEKVFPVARAFVRPGCDEINSQSSNYT